MTTRINSLLAAGLIDQGIAQVLEAAFRHWTSVFVCGGSPQGYLRFLSRLLTLQDQEITILLHEEGLEFEPLGGHHRAVADSSLSGTRFVQSALRQDPDCVIVDHRSLEAAELLLNAKLTGHRVIAHLPGPVPAGEAAFVQAVAQGNHFPTEFVEGCLAGDLFLALGEGDDPGLHEVWQLVGNSEAASLWRLYLRTDGGWMADKTVPRLEPCVNEPKIESDPVPLPEDWAPRSEPLLESLRRQLGPQRRRSWGPVFSDPPRHWRGSHFGGLPLLARDQSWPCCGACGERMFLVVQICLVEAPEPLRQRFGGRDGYFQFFYCISDGCSVEKAWAPFAPNSLARFLEGDLVEPSAHDVLQSQEARRYKVSAVTSWLPVEDFPDVEERSRFWPEDREYGSFCEQLEKMADPGPESELLVARYSEYLDYFGLTPPDLAEAAGYFFTACGDKLLGWPRWSQGAEVPVCPDCGQPMEMLVQINNDGHVGGGPAGGSHFGQLFAGDGNGHVWRCPDHEHMTFSWACG